MQLSRSHRFFLTLPSSGEVRVYPLNDTLEWVEERDISYIYRKKLKSKLIFADTKEHNTFTELYSLESKLSPCIEIKIRIEEHCFCAGTETVTNWNGILPFKKGSWDRFAGRVSIQPIPDDDVKCIVDKWDVENDFFKLQNRTEINSVKGELEYKTMEGSQKPTGYGWTLFQEFYIITDDIDYPEHLERTKWVRQKSETDHGGWTLENGYYYNSVITGAKYQAVGNYTYYPEQDLYIGQVIDTYKIVKINIGNALTLGDVINYQFQDCSVNIVSNFFGINPDLTAPENNEYRYAADYLQNLLIAHSSDIINSDASNPATKLIFNWEDFWNDLQRMFFIECFYNRSNNTLYIEHESYQRHTKKINLSNNRQIKGLDQYEYNDKEFPKELSYKFAFDTGHDDFDIAKFEFPSNCSNQKKGENRIENRCSLVVTNIARLSNNFRYEEDDDKLSKVCLIASSGDLVISLPGRYNSNIYNGPLAFTNLIENLGKHNKPLRYGKMNGLETQFSSVKKQRIQSLELSSDCKTINDFEPYYAVQTQMGLGEIESYSYTNPSNQIKMSLRV